MNLEKLYKEFNYPGIKKLYLICKTKGIPVTVKQVTEFVKSQQVNQIFNKPRRRNGYITAFHPGEKVQMDLLDLQKFKHQNNGYRYVFLAIDVFSRFLVVYPTKSKTISDVKPVIEDYIKHFHKPDVIVSDNEPAFMSADVQQLLTEQEIVHTTADVGDHKVLGIIDRVTQTIKNAIYKHFKDLNTTKYIDVLPKIIDNYNHTPNEGILDIAPVDAFKKVDAIDTLQILNHRKENVNRQLRGHVHVGDHVKVRLNTTKFSRSYDEKFTDDTYTVESIDGLFAKLDNGKRYNLRRLKVVSGAHDVEGTDQPDALALVKRTSRTERLNRKAGVDEKNIIEGKRIRKPKQMIDL